MYSSAVGEQIDAVTNFGIASHCNHLWVDKVTHQFAYRIATKDHGHQGHDDIGLGLGNAIVERLGLAAIPLGEEMHPRVSALKLSLTRWAVVIANHHPRRRYRNGT